MRGPILLLLASLVLGAGALVAGVSADQDFGVPVMTETTPPASARPTPPPAEATPTPTPTPERVSPTATAPAAQPASPGTTAGSRALGRPFRKGRLVRGVRLPSSGPDHLTWDAALRRRPSRPWRRWGTDVLVATLLQVLEEHRVAHPESPRILIGDLSRPKGGIFDQRFGGLGHMSHQNGLDVDVYYPRRDRRLIEATRPSQVDRRLSQDLVNRFVAAGAELVFVGFRVGLKGPRDRVAKLAHHDDHLHVRIPDPDGVGR